MLTLRELLSSLKIETSLDPCDLDREVAISVNGLTVPLVAFDVDDDGRFVFQDFGED